MALGLGSRFSTKNREQLVIFRVSNIDKLPDGFDKLVHQSVEQNFNFLVKMQNEWRSGVNRFNGEGEIVFGAFDDDTLVGVCGINIDPYVDDPLIGRLRHLYVSMPYRGYGLGSELVDRCMQHGLIKFTCIRLKAASSHTDNFYRKFGFTRATHDSATHVISLTQYSYRK